MQRGPCKGPSLRCGDQGLTGLVTMKGVGQRFSATLMRVHLLDGPSRFYTLTAGQPSVRLVGWLVPPTINAAARMSPRPIFGWASNTS